MATIYKLSVLSYFWKYYTCSKALDPMWSSRFYTIINDNQGFIQCTQSILFLLLLLLITIKIRRKARDTWNLHQVDDLLMQSPILLLRWPYIYMGVGTTLSSYTFISDNLAIKKVNSCHEISHLPSLFRHAYHL